MTRREAHDKPRVRANSRSRYKRRIVSSALLMGMSVVSTLAPIRGVAFSLLGPYADWMDVEKGYQQPGDIGGPMNIGEGYRWNIPVITYGFSRSFLDYFGSNGVAAVESAIAVLNRLPQASTVDPQSYTNNAWGYNPFGGSLQLLDLKSQTLNSLLEEMGLADAVRWTFCIRDFSPAGTNYSFYVIRRNFHPLTGQPSSYVNDTLFTYRIVQFGAVPSPSQVFCDAFEHSVDPLQPFYSAASAQRGFFGYGSFLTGLSRDDVGGLRYLLSGSQVRKENLLPDVHLAPTNSGTLVSSAYRPGVEKITFVRHPSAVVSGQFLLFTNRWTDIYYSADSPVYQFVERVTAQPDITFGGQDLGTEVGWTRSGTTNWANNSGLNGNPGGAGPGVIQPPIVITFNTVGPFYINYSPQFLDEPSAVLVSGWGSYGDSTNAPFIYPDVGITFKPTQVQFQLTVAGLSHDFGWQLPGPAYGRFWFQTATNLTDWTTLTTLTNSGLEFDYEFSALPDEAARFFRMTPAR